MTRTVLARPLAAGALAASALVSACGVDKSENVLSPSVAGPIAGVEISAPTAVEPAQGAKVKSSQQPIRLMVQNARTNGARPLWYTFELASDSAFTSKLFARTSITPGQDGKTAVQIDKLDLGRTYYWRARAEDGANTGPYTTVQFDVLPQPFLGAPPLLSPINNERTASRQPTLVVGSPERNAAVGRVTIELQVATDQAFANMVLADQGVETGAQNNFTPTSPLPASAQIYWRARATDGESTSPWSVVQGFITPAAPAPSPGPGPGPSPSPGGGVGACDALINDKPKLVECIHDAVNPSPKNEFEAFEITKRVAWALRNEGAGLLIKNSGENIVSWQGYSFSASRICYPDGHIFKVISDAGPGGANGAVWADNAYVDPSLYVRAIDPSKP
jgi:hypothetical protein